MSTKEASVQRMAEIIAQHRLRMSTIRCTCGWEFDFHDSSGSVNLEGNAIHSAYSQHVAEALAKSGVGAADCLSDDDAERCVTYHQQFPAHVGREALARAFGKQESA